MKKKIRFSVLLSLLIITCVSTFAQPFGQEPTERKSTYDVLHIKLDIKVDPEKKTLDGIV
jgi:hypothetical protein